MAGFALCANPLTNCQIFSFRIFCTTNTLADKQPEEKVHKELSADALVKFYDLAETIVHRKGIAIAFNAPLAS